MPTILVGDVLLERGHWFVKHHAEQFRWLGMKKLKEEINL